MDFNPHNLKIDVIPAPNGMGQKALLELGKSILGMEFIFQKHLSFLRQRLEKYYNPDTGFCRISETDFLDIVIDINLLKKRLTPTE